MSFVFIKSILIVVPLSLFTQTLEARSASYKNSFSGDTTENSRHRAEDLWWNIDFISFWKEVMQKGGIAYSDKELFVKYIKAQYPEDKITFFADAENGKINKTNLEAYLKDLKEKYVSKAVGFPLAKIQMEQGEVNVLAANGPCTNIGFESGDFSGWTGSTGDACRSNYPCNVSNGLVNNRHTITTTAMTDPYIPGLPVVAPGGNNSARLENYVNGGDASMIRQTFMVTATNNIFTYRYAAVLEDPGDHDDDERPYFKVRMYDQKGAEIKCASYTAIAKPPIQNFKYSRVKNPNYNPTDNNNNNDTEFLDLYYREWTTISIPLLAYIGQNVTIEFIASDCSRGGHLGYAYVDAECSYVSTFPQRQICGTQNLTYDGPDNFAGYLWNGPGIVGSKTSKNVIINAAGNYTLRLTPYADNPCPTTLNFSVSQHCSPTPITIPLCESQIGTGKVTAVNLNSFNTQATAGLPSPTVASWHTALPTATNKVANSANITIKDGDVYYAVITYPVPGADTTKVTFQVNSLPQITFPNLASVCKGTPAFNITVVTPAGGVFSGTSVNAAGRFNPVNDGTFNITYVYTDANGCSNSAMKPIVVKAPPTVNAGPDQAFCEDHTVVNLNATVTNAGGIVWSGGSGTFASTTASITTYTASQTEINTGSVNLTIATTGTSPCSAVSDNIQIKFEKIITLDAGPNQSLCSNVPSVTLGGTTSGGSVSWSGGNGTFNTATSLNGTYIPTNAEKNQGSISLTLTSTSNQLCPVVSDVVKISFEKVPTVNAGPDQALCEDQNPVKISATATNAAGVVWSGGSGTYTSGNSLITDYMANAAEINAGSINLKVTTTGSVACSPATDELEVTFEKKISVNAGPDQKLCSNEPSISLSGTASNGGVIWSGGSGTFSASTNLSGTYTPTSAEKNQGLVSLTLSSTSNQHCPVATDVVQIVFDKIPTVDAGQDQSLCETKSTISLNATSTNASGVLWSGGSGTFSVPGSLTTSYTASTSEIAAGTINLTITTTGVSACPPATDNIKIDFEKLIAVDAGPDQNLCADVASITLSGSTSSGSVVWSGGSGTFNASGDVSGIYLPSSNEIAQGTVTLTLKSLSNQLCPLASDELTLKFEKIPTVSAGPDQDICTDNFKVQLSGSLMNASGGVWSGGNGSFNSSNSISNPIYIPSADEVTAQLASLTYTSTGNVNCPAASDVMQIKINLAPTVDAGVDVNICKGQTSISLSGDVQNAGGGVWSNGSGNYSPDPQNLLATYTPSLIEINKGIAQLILTSINNGKCKPAKDTMEILIHSNPILELGPDAANCIGTSMNLSINNEVNTNYSWYKNAVLIASNTNVLPVQFTNTKDIYVIKATNGFACSNSDTISITGVPAPVGALKDTSICEGQSVLLHPGFSSSSNVSGLKPTYVWKKNNSIINVNDSSIVVSDAGIYEVVGKIGSCSGSASSTIKLNPNPVSKLPALAKICSESGEVAEIDAGPGFKYHWYPTNDTSRIIFVNSPGYYNVTITNQYNCSVNDSIRLASVCPPKLFISNSFTPNTDGNNEYYNVYGVHFTNFKMLIFNRWGEIIYETTDRYKPWDGFYRGEPMPIGVYPWIITYEGDSEEYKGPYKMEGSVTVVR